MVKVGCSAAQMRILGIKCAVTTDTTAHTEGPSAECTTMSHIPVGYSCKLLFLSLQWPPVFVVTTNVWLLHLG